MENNEEPKETELSEESSQGKIKQWFQDNLRILISVLIVVLIAGGIYSYSNRTEVSQDADKNLGEAISTEELGETNLEIAADQPTDQGKNAPQEKTTPKIAQDSTSSIASSQETEASFIQTAGKGDSQTTLARAALANYLEKNADSSLTAEHKIYIEDYLRKKVDFSGRVFIGTSVEFSKDLIQNAISQSKTLTETQLNNLHKYAVRVPSLS